jgi:hypothetical protein
MGEMSIVHGRITLRGNHAKARAAIAALGNDAEYPWLRAEMFSIGAAVSPFYYENPVIAFAATYKSIEHDWTAFVQKFEDLLRQIDFDTVSVELETEFYGTVNFFWAAKPFNNATDEFIEIPHWYFAFGHRTQFGALAENRTEALLDFVYPVPLKT